MLDYLDLHARYDAERERELERLPVCAECCEAITDDHYFDIAGETVCEECLFANHRMETDDYVAS